MLTLDGNQAGLFSAVSSAFVIDVQSKLEPDPNDMTAAYMKILIHAMNASLFPDADPDAIAWTGPAPGVVTVQALLYASLITSLFAAFVAVLGKQWVNRYIRNHGGSAADKSRDRQRKLDGFEKWHFRLVIESLPIMLQLAVLLLGCALSRYLWTISRPIAGMILAITLLGVAIYILLTLAATIYYNCPYQTPPSMITRTVIKYLSHSNTAFGRSLRSFIAPLPSITNLSKFPRCLRSGVRHVARVFGYTPVVTAEAEGIPLATVTAAPARIFEDVVVNWEVCKADVRCISWVLDFNTDVDVIFSTARFAADTIWYPEIAGALSPHTLADLFFDCLLDGQIIPGKLEHANSIGMALASVLSVQLNMGPESETLEALCQRLRDHVQWKFSYGGPGSEPPPAMAALKLVVLFPPVAPGTGWSLDDWALSWSVSDQLSTTHKLWLTRVVLQTLWRCQRVQKSIPESWIWEMRSFFARLMAGDGRSVAILRTNCFLIAAISLGLRIDIRDLYTPDNMCVVSCSSHSTCSSSTSDALKTAVRLFDQQFQVSIRELNVPQRCLKLLLLTVAYLDPFEAMGTAAMGFVWASEILNSKHLVEGRHYLVTSEIVGLLERYYGPRRYSSDIQPAWIPPLLKFLSLCEKSPAAKSSSHPGLVTLRILLEGLQDGDFSTALLPTLTSLLSQDHPLQSRTLALEVFCRFARGWFSPQIETVAGHRLDKLLQAVGDPFHSPPVPAQDQDGELEIKVHYWPMRTVLILIEFASSELWGGHLCPSNFVSGENELSTYGSKRGALGSMFGEALGAWPEFLCTPAKIVTAVKHLEKLGFLHTAQVVIMWAWVTGMADEMNCDGRNPVEDLTHRFYWTHSIRSLASLKHCIIRNLDGFGDFGSDRTRIYAARYRGPPFRVGRSRRPSQLLDRPGEIPREARWETDHLISQACQVRRLYHLFGYVPSTWQKEVESEEVDEEREVLSGRSVTHDPFVGWECDYP